MYTRFYKIVTLFFFLSVPVLFGQSDLDVDSVMRLEWQAEMVERKTYYLNLSVWGLVQKGIAPAFAQKLLEQLDVKRLSETDKLRAYLLLSLPASLTGTPQLPNKLVPAKRLLEEYDFSINRLLILDENWIPPVENENELIKNRDFLKYALQLFALSTFESSSLTGAENDKLLYIIDKLIYYYGEWLGNSDTEILIKNWKDHVASLQRLFAKKTNEGGIKGEFAILFAEWSLINSFFKFKGVIW